MLLGRVLEAEAIEGLALGGGLQALVFVIEFGVTLVVLALGPSAWLLVLLFLLWLGLIGAVSVAYWGALSAWTGKRLALTHDLVEKMAGHRTRRSQEPFESAHEGEDEALEAYLQGSGELDRWTVRLSTLLPGTFLVVGLLALSVAFVEGPTQTELAVMLGGILMAHGTLWRLLGAATSLGRAFVAWHKVGPLLEAARRAPPLGSPLFASGKSVRSGSPSTIVLDAVGISVRYAGRHGASLRDCSLRIRHGDRVLLTGPSGSGKSTLVSTLAGLRAPESGLVLLHGLDHHAVAQSTWRRSVVLTPQFHENHVIGGSFAFNLFMGSQWPVTPAALARAEDLCKELGLGDLLERMPGGMLQVVGETGWQMSHGERSRLFIARAILQQPEVLILDESFGALDPENMRRALDCVDRHARTMVVIDHP
jgi:ATP-binding cassette subfamily B protein